MHSTPDDIQAAAETWWQGLTPGQRLMAEHGMTVTDRLDPVTAADYDATFGAWTPYHCVVCDKPIYGDDPHTDEETGGDCHEECCTECHPAEAPLDLALRIYNEYVQKGVI